MLISETRTQNKLEKMKEKVKGKIVCMSRSEAQLNMNIQLHTQDASLLQKNSMVHYEQKAGWDTKLV
jgi:hypothetical protein